ncbi:hypothetical protein NELON_08550 [Neisseria elongata subsp. glycolytica ATCC 29315]|uniref:Uncharacterized protein n=1 Tax=Neisseria elongata subsp. glycolytica ATCC 29315 TaxID=546263 RepID=D4DP34_NEIEG|nr:hypothetical protein [Neisseria elongata]AJE18934.1 hypothetical protein NELON_08550 [Neisseria elongata subsp. glycolytica ATCC 29315]EFE50391.1 hypothetical protein NEIELOOT_00819 [Neisseria elongata subsp. glycolytica ATCC 29315]SQH50829.1 Uncharacterised protein [Neisseria elongata subsp. glycolytica]
MENLMIVIMTAAVSLLTSLTCWLIVGPQLKHVLAALCDDERENVKEISGLFWQRLYAGLTVFIPLLCVLAFAPNFELGAAANLLTALRCALMGGVILLLVLAYQIRQQIRLLQKKTASPPAGYHGGNSRINEWERQK